MSISSKRESFTNPVQPTIAKGLTAFRRMRFSLGWWGIILLGSGAAHNLYARSWGIELQFVFWIVATLVGLVGSVLIAPSTLDSGMFAVWGGVCLLGFVIMLLFAYPLKILQQPDGRIWLSVVWHGVMALGYVLTAYYMDKRWWFVVGWEVLVGAATLLILAEPLPARGRTPENSAAGDSYYYNYAMLNAELLVQQVQVTASEFRRNLGWIFGITSGVPLLIAALPFWKDTYDRG